MKIKIVPIFVIASLISSMVLADDNCFVIGFHDPVAKIYDGPTFCNYSKMDKITVHGPLQIKKSIIHGLVDVSGPVDASATEVGAIQIEKQISSQKIILQHHSVVVGNVVFKGLPGIVIKSSDTTIHGKVINGKVEEIQH